MLLLRQPEAVEEPVPARCDEVFLAAAAARVGRIPGSRPVAPALAIVVTEHGGAVRGLARPVPAGPVIGDGEGGAVRLGSGHYVVRVGRIAPPVHYLAPLRHGGFLVQVVVFAVELLEVRGNADTV